MAKSDKRPSQLAEAMRLASEVTTIGLEIALPPTVGVLADKHFSTSPWLALVGMTVGLSVGMSHLFRMIRNSDDPPKG